MSEKSCKLCDLYGICGASTGGCVKGPDDGCPFYRYFKKIFQPTTKNDLEIDCISRKAALEMTKEEKDDLLNFMRKERNSYSERIDKEVVRLYGKREGADYILNRLLDYLNNDMEEEE